MDIVYLFIEEHISLVLLFLTLIFAVYWVVTLITFYHLIRFGIGTQPKRLATVFLMGSVIFFCLSALFIFLDLVH